MAEITQEAFDALSAEKDKVTAALKAINEDEGSHRIKNKELTDRLEKLEGTLKTTASEKEQADLKAAGKMEEAFSKEREQLQATIDKLNGDVSKGTANYKSIVIDKAIIEASSGAISPRQVLLAAKADYEIDIDESGKPVVKKDGTVQFGEDGKAMGITDVVAKILADNPNFVPSGGGGSGSNGGNNNDAPMTSNDKISAGLGKLGIA